MLLGMLGLLAAWVLVRSLIDLRRGVARTRGRTVYARAEQPLNFWIAVVSGMLASIGGLAMIAAVVIFDLPVKP
jgi:hypothetical protein